MALSETSSSFLLLPTSANSSLKAPTQLNRVTFVSSLHKGVVSDALVLLPSKTENGDTTTTQHPLLLSNSGKRVVFENNTSCPIMAVYANPEASMKNDFRVSRETFHHLLQRIPNIKDHGWKPDMELLVFLYYLGHGLSLTVVSATFGMPKSTVHDIIHRVSGKITAKLRRSSLSLSRRTP
ncbi:hypothetical protein WMY93_015729 [Mugilogobius chulae]|uniref:Transposase Helix-turn-helix domain-containing protein n=1 Tax=Mugilogobius chulae TaxID=88201 RepID=A0AAW0NTI2_9GOBI